MSLRIVFGILLVALATPSWAQTFNETTDAGAFLGNAAVVPAGTTSILGSLVNTTESDVDLYRIEVASPGTFTIEVLEITPALDMNLLVFNGAGQGLAGDDDDNSGCTPVTSLGSLDSCLTLNLAAGTYYIGIGDNNMGAFENQGEYLVDNDFIDNDDGILGSPTTETIGRIGAEGGPSDINDEGDYRVNFSRAVAGSSAAADLDIRPIPVMPAWLAVLMAGMLALFGSRALRRRLR